MEDKNPSAGIVAAAHAYQLAMSQQPVPPAETEATDISTNLPQSEGVKDVTMTDQSIEVVWHDGSLVGTY